MPRFLQPNFIRTKVYPSNYRTLNISLNAIINNNIFLHHPYTSHLVLIPLVFESSIQIIWFLNILKNLKTESSFLTIEWKLEFLTTQHFLNIPAVIFSTCTVLTHHKMYKYTRLSSLAFVTKFDNKIWSFKH